jgi:hypothetical protein
MKFQVENIVMVVSVIKVGYFGEDKDAPFMAILTILTAVHKVIDTKHKASKFSLTEGWQYIYYGLIRCLY